MRGGGALRPSVPSDPGSCGDLGAAGAGPWSGGQGAFSLRPWKAGPVRCPRPSTSAPGTRPSMRRAFVALKNLGAGTRKERRRRSAFTARLLPLGLCQGLTPNQGRGALMTLPCSVILGGPPRHTESCPNPSPNITVHGPPRWTASLPSHQGPPQTSS